LVKSLHKSGALRNDWLRQEFCHRERRPAEPEIRNPKAEGRKHYSPTWGPMMEETF
jgi:hypothetical protein